jgi:hypothetical protein
MVAVRSLGCNHPHFEGTGPLQSNLADHRWRRTWGRRSRSSGCKVGLEAEPARRVGRRRCHCLREEDIEEHHRRLQQGRQQQQQASGR